MMMTYATSTTHERVERENWPLDGHSVGRCRVEVKPVTAVLVRQATWASVRDVVWIASSPWRSLDRSTAGTRWASGMIRPFNQSIHRISFIAKNSAERVLRSSPDLDPDLGWPWKSYRRECLIDLHKYHCLVCGCIVFDSGRTDPGRTFLPGLLGHLSGDDLKKQTIER